MKKFFTAGLLLFIGIWFLKLWYQGQIDFYILPRFNPLVIISGIIFCIFGTVLLFVKNNWHQVQHHIEKKSFFAFALLAICVLLIKPQPLSSQSVSKRGFETDLSQIRLTTPLNFEIDSTKRTFSDWIKIISTSENPKEYDSEKANITGFVYRDETLQADEFYLARFLIRCCSADARPVVLRIKSEEAPTLENDQWLEIEGVFSTDENPDQPLFIQMEHFKKIPLPETPYIY